VSKGTRMVAVALSVLALTGGLAMAAPGSCEPAAQTLDFSAPTTAAAPRNPALMLALQQGEALSAPLAPDARLIGQELGIQGLSFSASEAALRPADELGTAELFADTPQPLEFSLAAPAGMFDIGLTHRTVSSESFGTYVTGQGAEVRIGQGLALRAVDGDSSKRQGWYLFAASDGRALTWTPNSDPTSPNRNLRLQNSAEIGDIQAGLAMQRGDIQTSLSLVKRTVKNWIGPFKTSADDSFAGVTFSFKH
jgi:hypothetical protein